MPTTAITRLAPLALALTVAAWGCGGEGRPNDNGDSAYGDQAETTGTGDSGGGSASDGSDDGGAGTNNAGGGRTPTTAPKGTVKPGPGGGGPGGGGGSGGSDAAIAAAAKSGVGGFARVLLQPRPATRLVLEVLQQQGAPYEAAAVDRLASELRAVTGKAVSRPAVARISSADKSHSAAEIAGHADEYGKAAQGGGQAVLRLLYLDGGYENNANVLGVAVRGDVIAIFPDAIDEASTALVPPSTIEDAVVMHEAGHALGLVDLVIDTGRADPDHPGHSQSRESVMYWAVESGLVAQLLGGPPPTDFDAADRRDLAAIRNGG